MPTITAEIDEKDFLDRVDILCSLGQTVLISNFHEYYKLVSYLSKITKLKMGVFWVILTWNIFFLKNITRTFRAVSWSRLLPYSAGR